LKPLRKLSEIKELFLENNEISNIHELRHLSGLKGLEILRLNGNPCTKADGYRLSVIRAIPSLIMLDDTAVSSQEREESKSAKVLLDL